MDFSKKLPSFSLSIVLSLFVIKTVRLNSYIPFANTKKSNPLPISITERLRNLSNQLTTKKPFNPKEYKRDIRGKIYKLLKYSTWDFAKQELDNLSSIRWDSYIVNQVLKIYPPMEKAWLFFN